MDNFYNKIEDYINGTLPDQERDAFEEQLKSDEALKKEVELHRSLFDRLASHFQSNAKEPAFKDKLASISSVYHQNPGTITPLSPKRTRRNYAIGAAVAIAASILLLLWAPWERSLYDQYAKHPTANFTEMSTDQNLLNAAEAAFNTRDYAEASELLKEYTVEAPQDTEALFFQAIALMETDQFPAAEEIFQAISSGTSPYQYEAIWYLALLNLKQDNREATQSYLKQIPEGSRPYKKASELLRKL